MKLDDNKIIEIDNRVYVIYYNIGMVIGSTLLFGSILLINESEGVWVALGINLMVIGIFMIGIVFTGERYIDKWIYDREVKKLKKEEARKNSTGVKYK